MDTEQCGGEEERDAQRGARKHRAPRNPQARKEKIVEAAAEVLITEGRQKFTHRRIDEKAGVPLGSTTQYFESIDSLRMAGLARISDQLKRSYRELAEEVCAAKGDMAAVARSMHAYLAVKENVFGESALYSAAVYNPDVRGLVADAHEAFIEGCSPLLTRLQAVAVCTFLDGATVHAMLDGSVYSEAFLAETLSALVRTSADRPDAG